MGGGYLDNDNLAQLNFLKAMNAINGMDSNQNDLILGVNDMRQFIDGGEKGINESRTAYEHGDKVQKRIFNLKPDADTHFKYHDSSASFPHFALPYEGFKQILHTTIFGSTPDRPIYGVSYDLELETLKYE
ncbi:hypothetical protein [Paraferrimonas sp. SM1919]|uniref:hypothetical protein n=1 Tax=Paraferrimonas sp. SM1919 TaxID=2662263 RepID=UPI0013D49682|nr:hypothetical protein [Paraferrimonas sp. SM1919]